MLDMEYVHHYHRDGVMVMGSRGWLRAKFAQIEQFTLKFKKKNLNKK